ncbi:uncharacterized protein N7483_010464 [Penicillium malachiteum]|uniref:uncharacterized protein n=1 Tax=Penicillium malachiteum TaxID=1324776 RepID=UPI00254934F9|nr:uncharacterized protein N7483_010464 [Penicillium malachiteum]KAJ5713283.1 hypothetical protein N7483_010464 [Penicillium malachiteum]
MSDAPEPPRRPTSAHAAHLQYPTLPPLTASVEEWLSRSRPANNMASDSSLEPLPRSLEDSWATLSVSDLHSEDGSRSEQTDMGSLIDQATPDDVASLDERYSSSEVGEPSDEDTPDEDGDSNQDQDDIYDPIPPQFPGLFTPAAIDDSNLTTIPAHRQSISSIEFVEPDKWPEMERVELKHTIRIFEEPVASEMKRRLPSSPPGAIITAIVQQTMSKQNLALDKPFRVLYIGQPDCRNIVLDKIGDVLVSSSCTGSPTSSAESSRYHVVPTSFGAGAVPNFAELLPIHVQLVVDECVEATKELHVNQPRTLNLSFKNRPSCRSWWNGEDYMVSSSTEWTLPDVAILFVSNRDDTPAVQTRGIAHAFLERHGIPAMVISDEPLWEKAGDIIPLNQSSLHMCLESRDADTGETMVLRRYPIDLKTFESITPGQLNRNLASLIDLYPKKTQKVSTDMPKPTATYSFVNSEKNPFKWISPLYAARSPQMEAILRLVTLTLVSTVALSLGYAAVKTIALFIMQWIAGSALSAGSNSASVPFITSTALPFKYVEHTSIATRFPGDVGMLYDPANWVASEPSAAHVITVSSSSPPSDIFEIQVVGDCHLVIKPSSHLASSRKHPRFSIDVHRNEKALPHKLAEIFDGVYALRLEREDAYGLVNVTIVAKTKTRVNQTILVDFGTPWLKISNWREAARTVSSKITKDIQIAQTGLSEVYGRLSTDLQVIMGDVVKRSHFLRDDAEFPRHKSLPSQDSLLSHSKSLSEVITHNIIQRFRSMSSILHARSVHVNQEAMGLLGNAWGRLGKSASQVDLRSMMDRVRSAKGATLGRAQTRARHFMGLWGKDTTCSEENSAGH